MRTSTSKLRVTDNTIPADQPWTFTAELTPTDNTSSGTLRVSAVPLDDGPPRELTSDGPIRLPLPTRAATHAVPPDVLPTGSYRLIGALSDPAQPDSPAQIGGPVVQIFTPPLPTVR